MQQEPSKIRLKLSPQAERYARRDAPRESRLMAARGALPLPPLELATVLFALMHDPDAEVKSTARDSLEALPDERARRRCSPAPRTPPCSPTSRTPSASRRRGSSRSRSTRRRTTPPSRCLAGLPFKRVVDIVSNNQERMIRAPEIVEALGGNPLTGRAVIDRILSFLGVAAPARGRGVGSGGDQRGRRRGRAARRARRGARRLRAQPGRGDARARSARATPANLYALIQKMTVFQKIKLARLGNKEARSLLVKDRNKVVAIAAISSPKITTNEVISIAQSRNVHDEVLRMVSMNRLWTRAYRVKLALATNPKMPAGDGDEVRQLPAGQAT